MLQDCLFRAYRGLAGFERGSNFKAWIFRIMTNTFISDQRRETRGPRIHSLDGLPDPEASSVAQPAVSAAEWGAIYSALVEDEVKIALDDLPEEFRAPLLLSSLGGLRYKEIAAALDLPIGTVMSRLFRARQRMRESLRDYASARGLSVHAA